jgi:hypothetical protein
LTVGAYNTGTATAPSYQYPRIFGGWAQMTYFFTDKLFLSGWYGQMNYNMSQRFKNTAGNNNFVQSETQYIGNLSYDVNPAMRLGLEYDYIHSKYANYGSAIPASGGALYAGRSGSIEALRIGAWYFF